MGSLLDVCRRGPHRRPAAGRIHAWVRQLQQPHQQEQRVCARGRAATLPFHQRCVLADLRTALSNDNDKLGCFAAIEPVLEPACPRLRSILVAFRANAQQWCIVHPKTHNHWDVPRADTCVADAAGAVLLPCVCGVQVGATITTRPGVLNAEALYFAPPV